MDDVHAWECEAIRRSLYALRQEWKAIKAACEARKANFNPAQPRVPRGHADGGQWTDDGVYRVTISDYKLYHLRL